ncbi:hypothetical protein DDZ14_04310 [Maritimibacter sp. 55A14]|uniref:hypothetical protein n=1 Tax=Maritimibacter sp. 55A14 TaxID=2174844 RepID=UPI000D61D7D5|nr:hypothetical protein [Maritimibacter sp. 55A14]PWE33430.1 hypothetical protein DDZ14_04310 [Maritimibacter sp. 55A14]
MAKEQDWTPWYRRKEYKGNLTEEEKRHLDSFRLEEKHPAVAVEDLPEEVQGYLSELELAVYEAKQEGVATKAFVLTGIGAIVIFLAYRELGWFSPLVGYVIGGAIIAFAWVNYSREWKKNADGLWIKQEGKGVPFSRTEEKLQEYWELDAISRFRKRHEAEINDDLR